MSSNLPPGVTDDMIPGNGKFDEWYEYEFEDNCYLFLEDDKHIAISEALPMHAMQMEPSLKDDDVWDYVNSHAIKLLLKHFKENPKDEDTFASWCESRYENLSEPDGDAEYERARDK
jgi:hypothetical protein